MEEIASPLETLRAHSFNLQECASSDRVCRGKSVEVLEKLQTAFPKSKDRFKMVSGSAHSYVIYTSGIGEQLFIDPTISQFTKGDPEVFVGMREDLEKKVGSNFDNYLEYDGSIPKAGRRRKTRKSRRRSRKTRRRRK